jgi:hypothetical protein
MIERMCVRRIRALVDASGGAWRFGFAILQLIIFSMMLVQVFMVQDARLNGFLRVGTAVYCVVNAAFPLFPLHGPVAQLLKISPMRSLQVRMTGWGVAGVLICVGLAVKRTVGAFVFAFAALSFGWAFLCIGRMIGRELQRSSEQ